MREMKKLYYLVLIIFLASSCEYEYYSPEASNVDPEVVVSFNGQVVPIFEGKCIACHDGSSVFSLEADKAFDNITNKNLVNLESPEESVILTKLGVGNHSQYTYTATEGDLILFWIQQGAENN